MKIVIEFHATTNPYSPYLDYDGKTISYGIPEGTQLANAMRKALYGIYGLVPDNSEEWFDELCKTGRCSFLWFETGKPVLVTRIGKYTLRVDD